MATHLEAALKDFELVRDGEGKEVAFRFRFARCESFADTLDQFKAAIDYHQRRPLPDRAWLWEVDASVGNRAKLAGLFDNFEESYQVARSQLRMFG